jgi:hypothetical protein
VVMVNYLSRDHFARAHWSSRTKIELHPRTLSLLRSITNQIRVTLYYNKHDDNGKQDDLYSTIADLLLEYHLANPKITVQAVDYQRDPGAAEKVKADYKLEPGAKNLVIFDCEGTRSLQVKGDTLVMSELEFATNNPEFQYRRKPVEFKGEMMFSSALLAITSPKPLTAYFLEGHGESRIEDTDPQVGYSKFADILRRDYIRVGSLDGLRGANSIPTNCDLLIIGGPRADMSEDESDKIDQYLTRGGRLLAMFNANAVDRYTRLERLLARWGVEVSHDVVVDPNHSSAQDNSDVIVSAFSPHPLVNPLVGSGLYMIQPRRVGRDTSQAQKADAPTVDQIAYSSRTAFLHSNTNKLGQFPLMVAVEKGAIPGVAEHGARIIVAGDSLFLANQQLELTDVKNRDFASYAANWLLDRTQILNGPGPQPIEEYKIAMSNAQMQSARWVLLAGMPGSVLLLGCLVWFRRRK